MKIQYILIRRHSHNMVVGLWCFTALILCSGCTVSPSSVNAGDKAVGESLAASSLSETYQPEKTTVALTSIDQVWVGMSLSEVKNVMGDEVIVGYDYHAETGTYEAIKIAAPYKQEELTGKNILFYFTHIQKADELVADDELTPLIFEEGKLTAVGWDAYFRYKIPL